MRNIRIPPLLGPVETLEELRITAELAEQLARIVDQLCEAVKRNAHHIDFDSDPNEYYGLLWRLRQKE